MIAAVLLAAVVAAPQPATVQLNVVAASVREDDLGRLGLDGTEAPGVAVLSDRETAFKLALRLVALEEEGRARVIAHPEAFVSEGAPTTIPAGRELGLVAQARRQGNAVVLDVRADMKGESLRGSGPLGAWALLQEGRGDGEVLLLFVRSQEVPPARPPQPNSVN